MYDHHLTSSATTLTNIFRSTIMRSVSTNLQIPSSIYYADPYAAVRGILGNDVELVSVNEQPMYLPDSNVLVNVEYKMLDFDIFRLYKIITSKTLNNISSQTVATQIQDTRTKDMINTLVIISTPPSQTSYMFIKCIATVNATMTPMQIKYYGVPVMKPADVLHSFSSVVDAEFISYHGTQLTHGVEKIPKLTLNSHTETSAFRQLMTLKSNNYTGISHPIIKLMSTVGQSDLDIIKLKDISTSSASSSSLTKSCILDMSDMTPSQIVDKLVGKSGIIIVSEYRECLWAVVYIPSDDAHITSQCINKLLILLSNDAFNYDVMTDA